MLNHCPAHNRGVLARHNAIVERIKTAASTEILFVAENREVLEGDHTRPGLLLVHQRTAFIVDATIVCEHRQTSFEEARARKISKYTEMRQSLARTSDKVEIVPFLIGSLGSWDPKNESSLAKLCTRRYVHLCVSDTIPWSRDLYIEHVTGNFKRVSPSLLGL